MIKKIYCLATAGLLISSSLQAQNTPTPVRTQTAVPATSIATFTKDFKKFEGYFNFYYDEKTGKVFLEISKFGQEFLYFSSLTDGAGRNAERGGASTSVTKFIKVGPKVFLLEPNTTYRAGSGNADEIKTVEGSFAKSIIWGFVPVATEDGKVLIDFTPFMIRDSQNIGASIGAPATSGGAGGRGAAVAAGVYRIDETRSAVYLPNTKNFPKNSEFEAMLTFTGGAPSGRGNIAPDPNAVTVRMHQSFVELPDNNFKQRKFDPRSSFFQFSYTDFSAPMSEPLVKRFTVRHRLEKKDPNAKVSEAIKPIIYYIDRGAPAPIKRALIEGGA
ncbi:MAG: DUF5117 domain-containing protein, partial [Acinetobacter sp.]